jgi:hypothetical protein
MTKNIESSRFEAALKTIEKLKAVHVGAADSLEAELVYRVFAHDVYPAVIELVEAQTRRIHAMRAQNEALRASSGGAEAAAEAEAAGEAVEAAWTKVNSVME